MIAEAVKHMLAAGLSADVIVAAVRDMETAAVPSNRTARQDRNRRYYTAKSSERRLKASYLDDSDASPLPLSSETKVSPTPPSKTQPPIPNPHPPIVPPLPEKPVDGTFDLAWQACTDQMRKRAGSRSATEAEWKRAIKSVSPAALLAAVKRYRREDPDVARSGGPSFQRWLRDRKWEVWLVQPQPTSTVELPVFVIENRKQHYRDTGEWKSFWGPIPKEIAA